MSVANINICIDSEIKDQAQDVLASLGLDMTAAIDIFLRQTIRERSIPFEIGESVEPAKNTPKPGGWEGKIWVADDFDAPMEEDEDDEFSEYEDFAEPVNKVPKPGCMRGKIWMADDFDAPLEDFAEYM